MEETKTIEQQTAGTSSKPAAKPVASAVKPAAKPAAKPTPKPKKPRPVAFVRCAGGSPTCEDGTVCGQGCIGCGMCAESCKFGAISLNERGVAVVDREKCRGCSMCMRKCPKGIIEMVDPYSYIRVRCSNASVPKTAKEKCFNSCIGCGICERNCPADAIHVDTHHAHIDYAKCIVCGMCAVNCPRSAIVDALGLLAAIED